MRVFNKQIATNANITTGYTSSAVPLKSIYMYCMAAIISGSPTGTIKLQASNDPETNDTMPLGVPQPVPTNWVDIANSTFTITTSGESMWNVRDPAYNYVRVVYTGSGAATVNIIVNAKGM